MKKTAGKARRQGVGGWERVKNRWSEGLWKCPAQLTPRNQSRADLSLRFPPSVFSSNTGAHIHLNTLTHTQQTSKPKSSSVTESSL